MHWSPVARDFPDSCPGETRVRAAARNAWEPLVARGLSENGRTVAHLLVGLERLLARARHLGEHDGEAGLQPVGDLGALGGAPQRVEAAQPHLAVAVRLEEREKALRQLLKALREESVENSFQRF